MNGRLKDWARTIKRDVHAIYLAAGDPRTPWYAKALALCVAGYALSPIDLIPDFIPVLGYLDDAIIVPLGILAVLKMIPPEVMAEHRAAAALAAQRPVNRTAGVVIACIWGAFAALAAWLGYRYFTAEFSDTINIHATQHRIRRLTIHGGTMDTTEQPAGYSRLLVLAGGLCGAAGVALSAAFAHLGGAFVSTAASFLLMHAPVFLAVGLVGAGRVLRIASLILLVGLVLFCGDLLARDFMGSRLFRCRRRSAAPCSSPAGWRSPARRCCALAPEIAWARKAQSCRRSRLASNSRSRAAGPVSRRRSGRSEAGEMPQ
ncbi:hypothetical protein AJ88_06770 [Mesorhizobium amorphae CCBAU 01583]|nr:hypothetical protein AJ88_06770 [Mesorhizobium amorphae CCBAU 01583]